MLHRLFLAVVVAGLSVTCASAADRPTPEMVAEAVKASREKYGAAHPALNRQQKIEALEREIHDAESRIRWLNGPQAQLAVQKTMDKVKALHIELKKVKQSYVPKSVIRLEAFDGSQFALGTVGRINDADDQQAVYCEKVLDRDSMLVVIEPVDLRKEHPYKQRGSSTSRSQMFVLKGVEASRLQLNQPLLDAFDVVVTGEYSYEDSEGETQTMPIVERFDPDKAFK